MHIDKVVLHTNDLAAIKTFYQQLLGFAILDASATHISFSIGRITHKDLQNDSDAPFSAASVLAISSWVCLFLPLRKRVVILMNSISFRIL